MNFDKFLRIIDKEFDAQILHTLEYMCLVYSVKFHLNWSPTERDINTWFQPTQTMLIEWAIKSTILFNHATDRLSSNSKLQNYRGLFKVSL